MWCVLPAAGRGRRLAALTLGRPKPLLNVAGTTLIQRVMDGLGPDVKEVCVVVPPDDDRIMDAIGREWGDRRIRYVVQERPLGVGHAVLQAAGVVVGPFLVAMADAYFSDGLAVLIPAWREAGTDGAVLVEPPDEQASATMGRVHASGGRIQDLAKSPPDARYEWQVAGAMILPGEAFEVLATAEAGPTGEIEIEEAVSRLIGMGRSFAAVPYRGWRVNVNRPKDVARILEGRVPAGASHRPPT